MARLRKRDLLQTVEESVTDSEWNFLRLSRPGEHPARYQIYRDDVSILARIYIWNLTHGGGTARPAHEYRIQITAVSRFVPEPNGKTLILGWWDDVGVFAGFDFSHHSRPLGKSPSIQIGEPALRLASINGFAPHQRGQNEIAIAFRKDFMGAYVANLEILHRCGETPKELEILNRISEHPEGVDDRTITRNVSAARRYGVTSTRRALRDINFRARVLTAYGHRCAICGIQMKLVEGAHILPVAHPESTDETSNGIALCVLHHRAYDRSLVTFDSDYRTHINVDQLNDLTDSALGEGRVEFEGAIRPILLLPPDHRDHPNDEFITSANKLRGWKI